MKNKLKILLALVLVAPMLLLGVVQADTDHTIATAKDKSNYSSQLKDRLEKRKAEFKAKLEATEKTRLQTRCKAAQVLVKKVQTRLVDGFEPMDRYDAVLAKLQDLTPKLKAADVDTTEYEAHLAELETKMSKFGTDFDALKTAVVDLATMDCATDPEAFKASLQDARKLRVTVIQDATAVRAYLQDEFKPMLKKIRTDLASKKEGEM